VTTLFPGDTKIAEAAQPGVEMSLLKRFRNRSGEALDPKSFPFRANSHNALSTWVGTGGLNRAEPTENYMLRRTQNTAKVSKMQ
jgi:hypothetical protein